MSPTKRGITKQVAPRSAIWQYLIAFLVPTFLVLALSWTMDNDTYFVLAEGRQIVEHGLYYTDQLSMHDGLDVTVHNYSFAVISYLVYSLLGMPGLYIAMLLLNFALMFILYKICMLLSNGNVKLSLILMAVTDGLLAYGFIVTRAQMIDYVILASTIYILELYIKTTKSKYLWWIPIFSLILINFHAATWWMIFAILLAYLIGSIKIPKLHLSGYRVKPIILVAIIGLIVGFLNPYGLKMITFIFTSYGIDAINNLVGEMHPFQPLIRIGVLIYLAIVIVLSLYIFSKQKIKLRHLLLIFGFLCLGLNSIKGMSELILVLFFPLAYVYRNWQIPVILDGSKIGKAFATCTGIVTTCLTSAAMVYVVSSLEDAPSPSLKTAFNTIDESLPENTDKENLKLFVDYDNGGYAEFRGYHPYLDPRAEVFIKKNNGKADILQEWEDFENGDISKDDFLNKYDFDFLVTRDDEKLFDLDDISYQLIYDDGAEERGIRVYQKVEQ